jgi:hypothetical protein
VSEVHTIFEHRDRTLGIDDAGRLYWDGAPIVTEARYRLPWWVNVSIIATGLSTTVLALVAVLTFLRTL